MTLQRESGHPNASTEPVTSYNAPLIGVMSKSGGLVGSTRVGGRVTFDGIVAAVVALEACVAGATVGMTIGCVPTRVDCAGALVFWALCKAAMTAIIIAIITPMVVGCCFFFLE